MTDGLKLYGPRASVKVRDSITAADAADWTPDDESNPEDFILDAQEWENVNLTPIFRGTFTGESVDVEILVGVADPDNPDTVIWTVNESFSAMGHGGIQRIVCDGHLVAVRVTALTLGGADDVDLVTSIGVARRAGVLQA